MIISACTLAPQDSGMHAELHPPLVSPHWHVDHYTLADASKVCAVSSGYNGITVLLSNRQGAEDALVQSNRHMEPGATLTVNVGGGNFETYEDYFPTKVSHAIVDHLQKGDTAYLEWSEFSGPSGRERTHVQNIVPLNDFNAHLKECRDQLNLR